MSKLKLMKIILFITLIGILMFKPTSLVSSTSEVGKSLVLFVGDNDTNLDYPNYRLMSSNLNIDKIGEYLNVYKNKETGEIINKTIYVVDKNTVTEKTQTFVKQEIVVTSSRTITHIAEGKSKNSYFFTSTIKHEDSKYDWDDLYLTYVIDGEVIWDKLIFEERLTVIKDILVEDSRVVVVGEMYFLPSLLDIYIDAFDFSGNRLAINLCGGTLNEQLNTVIATKEAYYLVGTTESVKGEIGGVRDGKDMFLLILDYTTLKIKDVKYYNLTGNDECVDATLIDDHLYLFQKFKTGSFQEIRVVKTDMNGEIIDTDEVASGIYVTSIATLVNEGYIYFIVKEQTTNENLVIKVINENLESYNLQMNRKENESLKKAYISNDELVLFYYINNKGECAVRKINLREDEEIMYATVDYRIDNLYIKDDSLFLVDEHEVKKVSLSFLQIEKFNNIIIKNKDTKVTDGIVKIDGYTTKINLEKSNLEYDNNYFGFYPATYYYSGYTLDLCYTTNLQVLSNPSIIMNGIHDTNLVLTFNGEGYLNNQSIPSGYVITEEGDYVLKIIGKGNAKAEYKFSVQKQSLEAPILSKIETIDTNEIFNNIKVDQVNKSDIINVSYDQTVDTSNTQTIWWPLFIPVSVTSIAIILFMKGALV